MDIRHKKVTVALRDAPVVPTAWGRHVGVPLVVVGVPAPPPPEPGSWWARAAGALVDAGGGVLDALFG